MPFELLLHPDTPIDQLHSCLDNNISHDKFIGPEGARDHGIDVRASLGKQIESEISAMEYISESSRNLLSVNAAAQ